MHARRKCADVAPSVQVSLAQLVDQAGFQLLGSYVPYYLQYVCWAPLLPCLYDVFECLLIFRFFCTACRSCSARTSSAPSSSRISAAAAPYLPLFPCWPVVFNILILRGGPAIRYLKPWLCTIGTRMRHDANFGLCAVFPIAPFFDPTNQRGGGASAKRQRWHAFCHHASPGECCDS